MQRSLLHVTVLARCAEFQPFDVRGELSVRRRQLPHWDQAGATYFVTFRPGDSLPSDVLVRLQELREFGAETSSELWAWIDKHLDLGAGACVLGKPENAKIVADALRHFDGRRDALGDFAIMPNHVHALLQPIQPHRRTAILHSWKSFTAHQLQRAGVVAGHVWQSESFDRIVRDENELRHYRAYICENPVKARLASGRYLLGCGSARWDC